MLPLLLFLLRLLVSLAFLRFCSLPLVRLEEALVAFVFFLDEEKKKQENREIRVSGEDSAPTPLSCLGLAMTRIGAALMIPSEINGVHLNASLSL